MKRNIFLSVTAAQILVNKKVKPGNTVNMHIKDTEGYILASNVKSEIDTPPFDNSAMDGYAFRYDDFKKKRNIHIIGECAAGEIFNKKVTTGSAIRIFTGAFVPHEYDTVVMQEKVLVKGDELFINDKLIEKGKNIRIKGTQSKKGNIILKEGHKVTAATIGFLSSNGITRVKVFDKPSVAIIVTGNELVKPGRRLKQGQIYESNEIVLRTALHKEGIHRLKSIHVKDKKSDIKKAFKKFESDFDFILLSGGISVGDYDFTGVMLDEANVKCQFYKVRQKPGKPLYFGIKGKKYIFGLPGNPVSVLTCFYEYVLPAIRNFQNHPEQNLSILQLPLEHSFEKKKGMTVFYKAVTNYKSVKILPDQESYKMNSLADSNCFVVIGENETKVTRNEKVNVHLFP